MLSYCLHIRSNLFLQRPINLQTCTSSGCGRNLEYPMEIHAVTHANSTQTAPNNLGLWCCEAGAVATVPLCSMFMNATSPIKVPVSSSCGGATVRKFLISTFSFGCNGIRFTLQFLTLTLSYKIQPNMLLDRKMMHD